MKKSVYDFRDDISKIEIQGGAYILIKGKVDFEKPPVSSTDARGNVMHDKDIRVEAIVVEIEHSF